MVTKKTRLDIVLMEKGLASSRQRAQALVRLGKVLVNETSIDKPGTLIHKNDLVRLKENDIPYVSRGGLKLETALRTLDIDVAGSICLDVGASTGGFTDCLLQHGVHQVFAVDVGYGQLAWRLRKDPRVFVIERTNIRYLKADALPHPVDFITIDVSFISLKIVVPAVVKFMKKETGILALIKPQFEVGKGKVGKGGVVRDPKLHSEVIADLTDFFIGEGLLSQAVVPSPISGPKGNKEFFIYLKRSDSVS
jgi:23S rRNA (cytidine1920-2'-O)/16S rRNA (cytidine1409-2'-O)-methyltransferase